jgi:hypothetical protein
LKTKKRKEPAIGQPFLERAGARVGHIQPPQPQFLTMTSQESRNANAVTLSGRARAGLPA